MVGADSVLPFSSSTSVVPIIYTNFNLTMYNDRESTVYTLNHEELFGDHYVIISFYAVNATGDTLTDIYFSAGTNSVIYNNKVSSGQQLYLSKVNFTASTCYIIGSYPYNRSRTCIFSIVVI